MAFKLSKFSLERIQENVAQRRGEALLSELSDLHPADIAEVIDQLELEEARYVYEMLEPELAAEVLVELPEDLRDSLLENYTGKEIAEELIEQLDSDDAADVIAELPEELQEEVLANIEDAEHLSDITDLLTYDENTAGGIMAKELVKVNVDAMLLHCVRELRAHADDIEHIYVINVVDDHDKFMGTIPLKELVIRNLRTPVKDVYDPDAISVRADTDKEEVSRMMEKYNLTVLAVVDARGRLLGRITIDDVVDVIREEETEDVQRMAGMEALDYSYSNSSLWEMVKKRAGWLIVLFIGESFTATAMGFFEGQIEKAVVLALFIPLIISSGGNTGSQATTLVIRAMAIGEVGLRDWWNVMKREIGAGLVLGAFLAAIGYTRIMLWQSIWNLYGPHYHVVAVTVAVSLLGVILFGTLAGSMLPFLLRRLNLDPASASAPFVATLVDISGLVIYFTVAALLMRGTLL